MDVFACLNRARGTRGRSDHQPCAVQIVEACNTGPEPLVRQDTQAHKRDRLMWVGQNYVCDDMLSACNAELVAAKNRIALARSLGLGRRHAFRRAGP